MTETPSDDDDTTRSPKKFALPVGVSDFAKIRRSGGYYADKTALLHSLVSSQRPYFLSRPRRFGKSLIVSALENILKGRRELFKGLAIDGLEYDWEPHPVLMLEMNKAVAEEPDQIYGRLSSNLQRLAWLEKIELGERHPGDMLDRLLDSLYLKYGEKAKVAVLIDEYDAPVVRYIDRPDAAQIARRLLADFYGMLKTSEEKLGHVFITGVSRFAKTSMFSSLNNLHDITFDSRYSAVCGLTEADLGALLVKRGDVTLNALIEKGKMPKGSGRDDLRREIQDWYDGYSWDGKNRVYNPWAVLSFLDEAKFSSHWYESGTPGFLIDLIRNNKVSLNMERDIILNSTEAIIDDIKIMKPSVLMLQTGYMTIKEIIPSADGRMESFRLDLPNRDVAVSFMPGLLSAAPPDKTPAREASAKSVLDRLRSLDVEGIQRAFGDYLNKFKYSSILEHEAYYQSLLEVALEWAGQEIESQLATSQGVLDILFSGEKDRYIVELKVFRENKPKHAPKPLPPTDPEEAADLRGKMAPMADDALKQIREKYRSGAEPDPPVHGIVPVHGIAVVVARRTFVTVKIEKNIPPPDERPIADQG